MDWVSIVLITVVLLGLMYVVYYMKMNMAYVRVIKTMKKFNAVSEKEAKSKEEMNIIPRTLTNEMLLGREYSAEAIMELQKKQIIVRTKNGKLYLVLDNLAQSKWKNL